MKFFLVFVINCVFIVFIIWCNFVIIIICWIFVNNIYLNIFKLLVVYSNDDVIKYVNLWLSGFIIVNNKNVDIIIVNIGV